MAPLPQNSTARYWLDYTNGVDGHSTLFRYAASGGLAPLVAGVIAWLEALAPTMYEITITGARVSASGSTISLPVLWTGAATYGSGAMPVNVAPIEYRFEGRDTDGRRVSWSMFSGKLAIPDTYRYLTSDNADVSAAQGVLAGLAADETLITIASNPPVVYDYMNYNFNSYWEDQRRG